MDAFIWCLGFGLIYMCLASIMMPAPSLVLLRGRRYTDFAKDLTLGALAYGVIFFVGYQFGAEASALLA